MIQSLVVNSALVGSTSLLPEISRCCIGALWLKAGYFQKTHNIFQKTQNATGPLWHGIAHRLEGDFVNA